MTGQVITIRGTPIAIDTTLPAAAWVCDELAHQRWEEDTFDAIDTYCADGQPLVDIGAWVGIFSIYAAKKYGSGVVAFEPDPAAWTSFGTNIRVNNAYTIMRHPYAIWDADAAVTLHVHGELGDSMTGVSRAGRALIVAGMKVSTARLLCPADIGLLKVDVEGAEAVIANDLLNWDVPTHLAWHDEEAGRAASFGDLNATQVGNWNSPYPNYMIVP